MKAKEYFEKFGEDVWKEAQEPEFRNDGSFAKIYIAFFSEMKQLMETRNVKLDRAIPRLIDEQNQKWNAVCNLFEKKYGVSPLQRDGFRTAVNRQLYGTMAAEE